MKMIENIILPVRKMKEEIEFIYTKTGHYDTVWAASAVKGLTSFPTHNNRLYLWQW